MEPNVLSPFKSVLEGVKSAAVARPEALVARGITAAAAVFRL
jgi:hypothetical protein